MQMLTGSAGASYRWNKTLFTVDMRYGSGLPTGFANSSFNEPYVTANLGIVHELPAMPGGKPITLRLDIVNLFDKIYALRDGSGIGYLRRSSERVEVFTQVFRRSFEFAPAHVSDLA